MVQAEKDLQSLRKLNKEKEPKNVYCPACEKRGLTTTETQTSIAQYVCCLVMYTFGCECGCCLVPFCLGTCKDTVHKCGSCGVILGVRRIL